MNEDKSVCGFLLTESAKSRLKEIAVKNGLSMSQAVERLIKKWDMEEYL